MWFDVWLGVYLFILVTFEEQPILPKVSILGSVTAVAFINAFPGFTLLIVWIPGSEFSLVFPIGVWFKGTRTGGRPSNWHSHGGGRGEGGEGSTGWPTSCPGPIYLCPSGLFVPGSRGPVKLQVWAPHSTLCRLLPQAQVGQSWLTWQLFCCCIEVQLLASICFYLV